MNVDPQLTSEAILIAKDLANYGYSRRVKTGVNLALGCSSVKRFALTAHDAVKRWYACVLFII